MSETDREVSEVRRGLQAAAMALAACAATMDRITAMLTVWDERSGWAVPTGLAGGGVFAEEVNAAPVWVKAAAELRAAITPSAEEISAAKARIEGGG
jgi:hypothetical protein